MTPEELRAVAKEARDRRNKERPIELLQRIHRLMEENAKEGRNYLNFLFDWFEPLSIRKQVVAALQKEGFSVIEDRGSKHYTEISWANE